MSAAFTLNFFRSGINFNKWGSFQLPGLLNFGEFKVTPPQFPFCSPSPAEPPLLPSCEYSYRQTVQTFKCLS